MLISNSNDFIYSIKVDDNKVDNFQDPMTPDFVFSSERGITETKNPQTNEIEKHYLSPIIANLFKSFNNTF